MHLLQSSNRVALSFCNRRFFDEKQYTVTERKHFAAYHRLFKVDSKPKSHIEALSNLSDDDLREGMPPSLKRLVKHVIKMARELHE
ncbi:hypothetical protein PAERUG_P27_Wales_1_VIM_2_02_11_05776 [Pseudomonas aeruginosa]|nr:hypothetical protein PAERUG_P27_Wales_1_VIM_2_02_11_05776 [Pseudomonas aeruginosa]